MEMNFGTRKSKWAMAATRGIVDRAIKADPSAHITVVELDSPGDLSKADLAKIGGTTSFVDALSREVAAGNVDAAVHTVKDITWPSDVKNLPDGSVVPGGLRTSGNLVVAAVGVRNDARDALVFRKNESFETFRGKRNIILGTSSLLRAASFGVIFPDVGVEVTPIRGNIDKRLEKLDSGEYDLLILSMDGLLAVGQQSRASIILEVEKMPPALGQAIGAVEVREDNLAAITLMAKVNHAPTMTCLRAEWAAVHALGVTCRTPVGGLCSINFDGSLRMFAKMRGADGQLIEALVDKMDSANPELVGQQIAEHLIGNGAKEVEESWYGREGGLSQDAC